MYLLPPDPTARILSVQEEEPHTEMVAVSVVFVNMTDSFTDPSLSLSLHFSVVVVVVVVVSSLQLGGLPL